MQTFTRSLAIIALLAATWGSTGCAPKVTDQTNSNTTAQIKSDIKSDETVVFFPTYAYLDEDGKTWTVPIHGQIFEPETDSYRRKAMLAAMAKMLAVEPDSTQAKTLRRRMSLFLVDNERDKDISVRMGDKTYSAGTSEANGHFIKDLRLTAAEVEKLLEEQKETDPKRADGFITYQAVTSDSDKRTFTGIVQPIAPKGISIISDIDDTIKHSQVTDRQALLTNTFLKKFQPAPGMTELYRDCAQKGAVFHYVSGSPWQLYPPLEEFISAEGLPRGSFNLKYFRLKDSSALKLLQSQKSGKLKAIEPIMAAFPQRRFILIGDSGEQDPEIYAQVASKHPEQVVAIFIRNVTQEKPDNHRFKAVQEGLGEVRFMLFEQPDTLHPAMEEIFAPQK